METTIAVRAETASEVEELVTPDYLLKNVSDDWGPPIANVTVLSATPVMSAGDLAE